MNWTVDTPVQVGDCVFAAIVETRVSIRTFASALAAQGEKRPILFVLLQDEDARGIDVNGHRYKAEEIDVLYPKAIERIRALLKNTAQ